MGRGTNSLAVLCILTSIPILKKYSLAPSPTLKHVISAPSTEKEDEPVQSEVMYARQHNRQMVGPGSGGKGTLEDWKVQEAENNSPFTSKILQQT